MYTHPETHTHITIMPSQCKPGHIINPTTGRCIKENGPTHQKLMKQAHQEQQQPVKVDPKKMGKQLWQAVVETARTLDETYKRRRPRPNDAWSVTINSEYAVMSLTVAFTGRDYYVCMEALPQGTRGMVGYQWDDTEAVDAFRSRRHFANTLDAALHILQTYDLKGAKAKDCNSGTGKRGKVVKLGMPVDAMQLFYAQAHKEGMPEFTVKAQGVLGRHKKTCEAVLAKVAVPKSL